MYLLEFLTGRYEEHLNFPIWEERSNGPQIRKKKLILELINKYFRSKRLVLFVKTSRQNFSYASQKSFLFTLVGGGGCPCYPFRVSAAGLNKFITSLN